MKSSQEKVSCRLCGHSAESIGILKPYLDYTTPIYACGGCGARLAVHDPSVHERLHANTSSSYAWHRGLAAAAADFFSNADRQGLRALLDTAPKNRLIMTQLDSLPRGSKVLEVGCSRGYLTAYALLCGHQVLGVDVAPDAIAEARELFGDHFVLIDDSRINQGVPYDLIYHVGTIGCVDAPVELILSELSQLRRGGLLVCNAPDVAAAQERGHLWSIATTPPDLVTLFDRKWFASRFSQVADVKVEVAPEDAMLAFRRLLKMENIDVENSPRYRLFEDGAGQHVQNRAQPSRSVFKNMIRRIVGILHRMKIIPNFAHEYGILVTMTKR